MFKENNSQDIKSSQTCVEKACRLVRHVSITFSSVTTAEGQEDWPMLEQGDKL